MTMTTDLAPISTLHSATRQSAQRLRNVLRINAATSFTAGLVALVFPGPVDGLLGADQPGWVRLVGLGLTLFAVDVAVLAGARTGRLVRWSPAVVAADLAWVGASVAAVAVGWFAPAGTVAVTVTAGLVGTFAVLQRRHLAALRRGSPGTTDEAPPVEIAAVTATVNASAEQVWDIITDHQLYGRLARNLSRVEATAANGPGLTRTCANRKGREWQESCTLWDEGHRYEVAVDTRHYPYPLAMMRGAWSIEPGPDRATTTATMQFAYQPTPTLRGRLFAGAMQAAFPIVLRRILRGWRDIATGA